MARPLYIVTGADWTHARSLLQLLNSVNAAEPAIAVVVYDLGLTKEQLQSVRSTMTRARLERFRFEDFPSYFDISKNAGEYAWKPVIVAQEMERSGNPICWMDAGNVVRRRLHQIRWSLRHHGFFAQSSSGTIPQRTHPGMLRYLGLPDDWGRDLRNLSAACVAADPLHPLARRTILEWAEGAQEKTCIAPDGSSRANHRQDQALLTVLAYRNGLVQRPNSRLFWRREFYIQQDVPAGPTAFQPR